MFDIKIHIFTQTSNKPHIKLLLQICPNVSRSELGRILIKSIKSERKKQPNTQTERMSSPLEGVVYMFLSKS